MATPTPSPWSFTGSSTFARDARFRASKSGRSQSQAASKGVDTFRRENGFCRGSIIGMSKQGDKMIGELVHAKKKGRA